MKNTKRKTEGKVKVKEGTYLIQLETGKNEQIISLEANKQKYSLMTH